MANFDISAKDMLDPNYQRKIVGQISKDLPKDVINLTTSRHKSKRGDPLNVTMFNISELLMGIPAFDSVEDTLSRFESIVSGAVGGLLDAANKLPGIGLLIPNDIKAKMDSMKLTDGKAPSANTTDGTQDASSVPDVGFDNIPKASGKEISKEDKAIIQYIRDSKVPSRITSTTNHGVLANSGNPSNHRKPGTGGDGLACDVAGPKVERDSQALADIFNAYLKIELQLAELIYAGPQVSFNIKDGKRVAQYAVADHHDHVHVAVKLGTFIKWQG